MMGHAPFKTYGVGSFIASSSFWYLLVILGILQSLSPLSLVFFTCVFLSCSYKNTSDIGLGAPAYLSVTSH